MLLRIEKRRHAPVVGGGRPAEGEKKFRQVQGCREIPKLVATLGQTSPGRKEVTAIMQLESFLLQRMEGTTSSKMLNMLTEVTLS